ncbi:MAG: DUF1579 family protein [Phycisphaeraceae bacterium]|nr:DUF1579 family protein [Phycisphaeraceae bacterium]MCB9848741.1 DUF1579 family protein [Phycisphaeraceae bacterium]
MPSRSRTALALAAAGFCTIALAADQPAKIAPPPQFHTDMSKLEEAATPGLEHRFLGHFVGDWSVAIRQKRPGAAPVDFTATATFSWILDGRFLREDLHAEIDGFPIDMIRFLGYDRFRGRYTLAWMGSTSTAITTAEGDQNVGGDEITLFGVMDEPHLDLRDRSTKTVYRSISKDRFVVELHDLHIPDPNSLVLSMRYTRVP